MHLADAPFRLSENEKIRLFNHSKATQVCVLKLHQLKESFTTELMKQLQKLAEGLRRGGSHQAGEDAEELELNAGAAASEAIVEFEKYWGRLDKATVADILQQHPTLEESISMLMRPQDSNYLEVSDCVDIIATQIDSVCEAMVPKESRLLSDAILQSLQLQLTGRINGGIPTLAGLSVFSILTNLEQFQVQEPAPQIQP